MRLLFLLTILGLISSCGQDLDNFENNGSAVDRLGAVVADSDELLTTVELDNLKVICEAIKAKEAFFNGYVINKSVSLNYDTQHRPCQSTITSDYYANLRVVRGSTYTQFTKVTGSNHFFVEYETTSEGYFSKICKESLASEPVRRAQGSDDRMVWTKIYNSNNAYCPVSSNTKCAMFFTGENNGNGKYVIKQIEALTINVASTGDKRGMVVARGKETQILCENGKIILTSLFKDFQN